VAAPRGGGTLTGAAMRNCSISDANPDGSQAPWTCLEEERVGSASELTVQKATSEGRVPKNVESASTSRAGSRSARIGDFNPTRGGGVVAISRIESSLAGGTSPT
jgi:hypothetical protein